MSTTVVTRSGAKSRTQNRDVVRKIEVESIIRPYLRFPEHANNPDVFDPQLRGYLDDARHEHIDWIRSTREGLNPNTLDSNWQRRQTRAAEELKALNESIRKVNREANRSEDFCTVILEPLPLLPQSEGAKHPTEFGEARSQLLYPYWIAAVKPFFGWQQGWDTIAKRDLENDDNSIREEDTKLFNQLATELQKLNEAIEKHPELGVDYQFLIPAPYRDDLDNDVTSNSADDVLYPNLPTSPETETTERRTTPQYVEWVTTYLKHHGSKELENIEVVENAFLKDSRITKLWFQPLDLYLNTCVVKTKQESDKYWKDVSPIMDMAIYPKLPKDTYEKVFLDEIERRRRVMFPEVVATVMDDALSSTSKHKNADADELMDDALSSTSRNKNADANELMDDARSFISTNTEELMNDAVLPRQGRWLRSNTYADGARPSSVTNTTVPPIRRQNRWFSPIGKVPARFNGLNILAKEVQRDGSDIENSGYFIFRGDEFPVDDDIIHKLCQFKRAGLMELAKAPKDGNLKRIAHVTCLFESDLRAANTDSDRRPPTYISLHGAPNIFFSKTEWERILSPNSAHGGISVKRIRAKTEQHLSQMFARNKQDDPFANFDQPWKANYINPRRSNNMSTRKYHRENQYNNDGDDDDEFDDDYNRPRRPNNSSNHHEDRYDDYDDDESNDDYTRRPRQSNNRSKREQQHRRSNNRRNHREDRYDDYNDDKINDDYTHPRRSNNRSKREQHRSVIASDYEGSDLHTSEDGDADIHDRRNSRVSEAARYGSQWRTNPDMAPRSQRQGPRRNKVSAF